MACGGKRGGAARGMPRLRPAALAAGAALMSLGALAQGEGLSMAGGTEGVGAVAGGATAGPASRALPALRVTARASATATLTDNADLDANSRRTELILQAGPSIDVSGQQGGLRGALSYNLQGVAYARGTEDPTLQHQLAARLTAEPVPERLRIDAAAGISQELLSAFGVQSTDRALGRGNSTQVATVSVSPSLKGPLAGLVQYELRLAHSRTHPDEGADSASTSVSFNLGPLDPGRLSWSLGASSTLLEGEDSARDARTDTVSVGLGWAVLPELRISASAGRERQDIVEATADTGDTWSIGVNWSPTPRTTLQATRAERFFGAADTVVLTHRFARAVVSYSDTRSVGETGGTGIGLLTIGDLLERQLLAQIPDATLRAREVTRLLAGADPRTPAALYAFRFGAASVTRSQQLALAWTGLRTGATLAATRSQTRRLDTFSSVLDDLSGGNVVSQDGLSATLSHRLTPTSTLSLAAARTRSAGSVNGQRTGLDTLQATWSTQLARRISLALTARHAEFDSSTQPYDENAIVATVGLTF